MRSIGYGWGSALALAALAMLCFAQPTAAAYPERTIRLVVAYPAGGTGDLVGRIVADALSARLGVSVVVENQSGASGALPPPPWRAADRRPHHPARRQRHLRHPPAPDQSQYDGVKGFPAIANLSKSLRVLAVNPAVPAKTLPEFVDHARRVSGQASTSAPPTSARPCTS